MKLNMSVFYDWLKEYDPQAEIHSDAIEINTVRLFSHNLTTKQNCLYVGKLSDLFKNGEDKVICTHNNDILILNTDDEEEVLNSVLNAFEFYSTWDTTMLEQLNSSAMLQDLLDCSENVLHRPVFILDSGQRHLASSRNYPVGSVDELWDELITFGSSNLDKIISLNTRYPDRFFQKDIYQFEDPNALPNKSYHCNFFLNNKWVGKATVIDTSDSMTQGEVCLFTLLCKYIDRWFQTHIQELDSLRFDRLLRHAIEHPDEDTKPLIYALKLNGWDETDTLSLILLNAPYQPFNINTHLCNTLNQQFSNIFGVTFDQYVCLLCNLSQTGKQELSKELAPWLRTGKYYGVYSRPFTMNDSFYTNYQYALITGQYCDKMPGELYDGNDYFMRYIFHEMQNQATVDLCHPALTKLLEYDKKHHTEFSRTLKVYLSKERSNIETARALSLHRNTLAYRISKLEELLEADLNDSMTRLHLLLSFEFLGI